MHEGLRWSCLALYSVGPAVAVLALLRRRFKRPTTLYRVTGWRGFIPTLLLPIEWFLPPALIFLDVGTIDADWPALRLAGFAVALGGTMLLMWAVGVLGRYLVHDAAVLDDHDLITSGPYRFVRHPIYAGYLALLLGSGVATLNAWLMLLWPLALLGILLQAKAEEQLLRMRFGADYERYVSWTGRFIPRFWR